MTIQAYNSVPEKYKALSEAKSESCSDLELVLLDISADGIKVNTPRELVRQHLRD